MKNKGEETALHVRTQDMQLKKDSAESFPSIIKRVE